MLKRDFYQNHLNRVSRSFAFCIARLDGDLRDWVALSYLLFRILDTVEDAPWDSKEEQTKAFQRFRVFLANGCTSPEVEEWLASFPEIPAEEKELLRETHRCLSDLHELPPAVRGQIIRQMGNMEKGMRHFLGKSLAGGRLRLTSVSEVNQYCFFVAGLVGELLTDLFAQHSPHWPRPQGLYQDAAHFGLFLQKINLLKDQKEDEAVGRFLVPNRKELLASLAADAEGAIRYLQSLPVAEKGFRLFCAWSLFLGLLSLPWIERSQLLGIFSKLPRLLTEKMLQGVERVIDDNQALLKLFREMLPALPRSVAPGAAADGAWIQQAYEGALSQRQFSALGLLPA